MSAALTDFGHEVVITREPGGTELAEKIRSLVLDPDYAPVDPVTEAMLFAAARAHHVRELIRPALKRGAVVVCDRFVDSSVAYQGAGRELGEDWVLQLNERAVDDAAPNLTVLLDLPIEAAQARREDRERAHASTADRIEAEGRDFQSLLRQTFLRRAAQDPEHHLVVDASASAEHLTSIVLARMTDELHERSPGGER